jgi:hypothetical protein
MSWACMRGPTLSAILYQRSIYSLNFPAKIYICCPPVSLENPNT